MYRCIVIVYIKLATIFYQYSIISDVLANNVTAISKLFIDTNTLYVYSLHNCVLFSLRFHATIIITFIDHPNKGGINITAVAMLNMLQAKGF